MAPEQHAGKSADALSDQFSFCVSLYESLHGRRPFPGQTAAEIAAAVRSGEPPPGGDGIPRDVDRVIARGLTVAPANRYPSMEALLAALARAGERRALKPVFAAGALGVVLATTATAAIVGTHRRAQPASVTSPVSVATRASAPADTPAPRIAPEPAAGTATGPRSHARPDADARKATALAWARRHPQIDARLLLDLADGAHADRNGAACLDSLNKIPMDAWPPALSDRALRRRATCEMLRGNCEKGRRLLGSLDGGSGGHATFARELSVAALPTLDERIAAVSTQADEARYAGNRPARREDLKQALQRQTASPQMQACFRNRDASRFCGRRLAALARAYQVLAESFLAARDCAEGATLDVMHSQVVFQSFGADGGDPALRCRSQRVFTAYRACADAGEAAERRCLARVPGK
jgi:hypothetical protein